MVKTRLCTDRDAHSPDTRDFHRQFFSLLDVGLNPMTRSWELRASKERPLVTAFFLVSVVPLSLRILLLILDAIFGGRESSFFYTPLVALGMFIYPSSWLIAVACLILLTLLTMLIRTPATLALGIQGLGMIVVINAIGFMRYCEYVYSFSSWATLQYLALTLTSLLLLFLIRSRSGQKAPSQSGTNNI